MNNNYYNKYLKNYANSHRKNMTKSEACLWKYILSKRQMLGYQFRRQRPIYRYIADFACLPLKLIIEVDGSSHDNEIAIQRDQIRDQTLHSLGYTTLRFSAWEVLNRIDDVDVIITEWIKDNAKVPPSSRRRNRR